MELSNETVLCCSYTKQHYNHLMYTDAIVLLATSGKGIRTSMLLMYPYNYDNAYAIVFNITK